MSGTAVEKTSIAVQALWLRYKGLQIEASRSWQRMDNAAYRNISPMREEDLSRNGGFLVAS